MAKKALEKTTAKTISQDVKEIYKLVCTLEKIISLDTKKQKKINENLIKRIDKLESLSLSVKKKPKVKKTKKPTETNT